MKYNETEFPREFEESGVKFHGNDVGTEFFDQLIIEYEDGLMLHFDETATRIFVQLTKFLKNQTATSVRATFEDHGGLSGVTDVTGQCVS